MSLHCFSHLLLSFLACVISYVYHVYQGLCGLIGSSLFCTGACWSKILLSDEKYNLTRSSCPAVDKLFTIDVKSFEKHHSWSCLFYDISPLTNVPLDFQSAIYTEHRSGLKHTLPWQQMMLSQSSRHYAISYNPTWIHWRVWAHILVELSRIDCNFCLVLWCFWPTQS